MGKCCMRNCYGIEMDELKDQAKQDIPSFLIEFLLDLSKCTNSQSQKNGLANFNSLAIYITSQIHKLLDDLDRNGSFFDMKTLDDMITDNLAKLIEEFDYLMCNGGSKDIDDINKEYNTDSDGNVKNKYPSDLSDTDKDKIREGLDGNNNYNDNIIDSNGKNNVIIVEDGKGNGWGDDLFGDSNSSGSNNPLINIPNDVLSDIDLSRKIYKCFDPVFNVYNYVYTSNANSTFVTNARKRNIKRVHDEILLPIYKHYYGENASPTCQIGVIFGLGHIKDIREIIGGSYFSRHLYGEAVDFSMVGIDPSKLVSDIKSGDLKIPFGVLAVVNGTHITLPYSYEGLEVKGMILTSPKNSRSSLKVELV